VIAVLYRWRVDPAKEREFEEAWGEGTRLIHERCGSFGARLHKGADGLYWSYALWPDEETRRRCFKDTDIMKHESFGRMRTAIIENFEEIHLDPRVDVLDAMPAGKD
jgi:heme-degrading monooxygenase HmoA